MKVILVGANSLPPELLKLIMAQADEVGMETEIQTKEELKNPSKVVPEFIPHPAQIHAQEQSEQEYWFERLRMAASACLRLKTDSVLMMVQGRDSIELRNNLSTAYFSAKDDVSRLRATTEALEKEITSGIKYPHYVKYIGNEIFMDFYGLCRMYDIKDDTGSLFHAQKKLLNLGKRGDKDYIKDLREGIESLQVHLREKLEEEFNANVVT